MSWLAVVLATVGCYAAKVAGLSVPRRLLDDARIRAVAALLPVGLLAGLTALQTFGADGAVTVDARLAGVAVAAVAVARKAPFLVVVALAVATTAGVRALS